MCGRPTGADPAIAITWSAVIGTPADTIRSTIAMPRCSRSPRSRSCSATIAGWSGSNR